MKQVSKPWYKISWKQGLVVITLTLLGLILAIISLYKPQKVIIEKPIGDIKTEQKSVNQLVETESFTKQTTLRKLEPLETGKHLAEIPNNIYGFAISVAFSWGPKIDEQFITLSNTRETNSHFEVQKFNNKYYLVGFIGDETYANIGKLNKSSTLELTLFALPWENFRNIVAIPFKSISRIDDRRINIDGGRSTDVLDIVTNNIITDIQAHDLNKK